MLSLQKDLQRQTDADRYIEAAISAELLQLTETSAHRNHQIHRCAFKIATLLAGAEREDFKVMTREAAEQTLFEAATANGYVAKDGAAAAWATIRSGFSTGWSQPRNLDAIGSPNRQPLSTRAPRPPRPESVWDVDTNAAGKLAAATRIWDESVPVHETPAARYLSDARGIDLERLPEQAIVDIQFHSACPLGIGATGEQMGPALVVRLRDPETGKPTGAIQRTFLAPDGSGRAIDADGKKIDKKGLAPYRNGVVMIGTPAPGDDLHIAEGIEDALTAAAATGRPAVATLGSARLTKIELPFRCRRILLAQTKSANDAEGWRKAAQKLADQGHNVRIAWPSAHSDFNDLLRSEGPNAVAKALAEAADVKPEISGLEFDHQIALDGNADYVVKGVIDRGDIVALYGPSGVGKTFFALDLAHAIATCRAFCGRKVRRGCVLYVALEGQRGLRRRMRAYAQELGPAGGRLARLTVHASLDKSEAGALGAKNVIQHAKKLEAISGEPVALIVIDTLARAMAGDDENTAADMAAFIQKRIGRIVHKTGAAVLIVHHPGKDQAKGMRGSGALFAACDAVIKITEVDGRVRNVSLEKCKDAESGPLSTYRLKQIDLGTDDEGEAITSCVVEPIPAADRPSQKVKLPRRAAAVLEEFNHLIINGKRFAAPSHHDRIPAGAVLVKASDLWEACRRRGICQSTQQDQREREKVQKRGIKAGIKTCVSAGALAHFTLDHDLVYWRPDQLKMGHWVQDEKSHSDPPGSNGAEAALEEKNQQNQIGAEWVRTGPNASEAPQGLVGPAGPPPYKGAGPGPGPSPAEEINGTQITIGSHGMVRGVV